MINLIPPTAKKQLVKEYWVRVFSVWLLLGAVVMIVGSAVLFPAYFLANAKINAYEAAVLTGTEKVADYATIASDLERVSKQAKIIVDESKQPLFTEYIDLFYSLEGEEIQINEVSILREDTEVLPAKIAGIADNRQALASFRDRLLAQASIAEADLPISNLAQDKDIVFDIEVIFNKTSHE